jgi:hypothetical protein
MRKSIVQIAFAFFIITSLISCHDHEHFISQPIVNVQFDSTRVVMLESATQQVIRINFDRPATADGSVKLLLNDVNSSRFIFDPSPVNGQINLKVYKNQQSAELKVRPVNNSYIDGNTQFNINISFTTIGFTIGDQKTITVVLLDDDTSTSPQSKAIANFVFSNSKINESAAQGSPHFIQLSKALTAEGSIEISLESTNAVYGTHYTTEPGSVNGKIILTPMIGSDKASFIIFPINNWIITGEMEIHFVIAATTGAIEKGTELIQHAIISDDELTNKPRGYVVGGGLWSLKKIYEYDEAGRVKYVHIEKGTPATSTHTETYFYNQAGLLQKINTYPQVDIIYTWANNNIAKSEVIDHGVIKEYVDYDYDLQGNVSGAANYYRQPNGQFKLAFLNIYLYYTDNNLYKSQIYLPGKEAGAMTLISTRTYEGYLEKANPFPMVEIIPTSKTQSKLPTLFTINENGLMLNYNLSYEFREDGLVTKRTTRNGSTVETSNYLYY